MQLPASLATGRKQPYSLGKHKTYRKHDGDTGNTNIVVIQLTRFNLKTQTRANTIHFALKNQKTINPPEGITNFEVMQDRIDAAKTVEPSRSGLYSMSVYSSELRR